MASEKVLFYNHIDDSSEFGNDDNDIQPAGKRWDPLGAADEDDDNDNTNGGFNEFYANDLFNQEKKINRIRTLEEEQEILTSSLLSLTSLFAQVQFRLRQIVDAPNSDRDDMLKNLEEFAFRGIPDIKNLNHPLIQPNNKSEGSISSLNSVKSTNDSPDGDENILTLIESQKNRQYELIDQLRSQLHDLEQSDCADDDYELFKNIKFNIMGLEDGQQTSSSLQIKKQLIQQIKAQISELERFISYLQDESEKNPKNSEKVRNAKKIPPTIKSCKKPKSIDEPPYHHEIDSEPKQFPDTTSIKNTSENRQRRTEFSKSTPSTEPSKSSTNRFFNAIAKSSTLFQIFAMTQMGCGASRSRPSPNDDGDINFQKNTLKKSNKFNHWGDIRAQLEIDVQEIVSLSQQIQILFNEFKENSCGDDDYDEDDEENLLRQFKKTEKYHGLNTELTAFVRKNFAITLKRLIQHGLYGQNESTSIVPFIGCLTAGAASYNNRRSREDEQPAEEIKSRKYIRKLNDADDVDYDDENITIKSENHFRPKIQSFNTCDDDDGQFYNEQQLNTKNPWELILEYYFLNHGDQYNDTPARKLSSSFNLNIVDGSATSKQSLLSSIGKIIAMHNPYKRSYNAHFKAFVCSGLNSKKLCQWLNLIFQCNEIVSIYYNSWSYVGCTGFRDALKSMERFNKYDFDLPVDLAIRQFQNIKDVFL